MHSRHRLLHILSMVVSVGLIALWAPGAFAKPAKGTKELRLASTLVFGAYPGLQPGVTVYSPSAGSSTTLTNLGGAMGYFTSDNIEVGTGVHYVSISGSGNSVSGPSVEPFLKFFSMNGNTGMFLELAAGWESLSESGSTTVTVLSIGADAGLELFLAEACAIRVGPSYRHMRFSSSGQSSEGADVFGLNYGLVAYF